MASALKKNNHEKPVANPEKRINHNALVEISGILSSCPVMITTINAMINTTMVRIAVARFELTFSMPTFARIAVNEANRAANNAKIILIMHLLFFYVYIF
jgi:hypothetical protein